MSLSVNLEYLLCRQSISISAEIKWVLFGKNTVYTNSSNIQILIVGSIPETDGKMELNTRPYLMPDIAKLWSR